MAGSNDISTKDAGSKKQGSVIFILGQFLSD
jgi:hypothetical protein